MARAALAEAGGPGEEDAAQGIVLQRLRAAQQQQQQRARRAAPGSAQGGEEASAADAAALLARRRAAVADVAIAVLARATLAGGGLPWAQAALKGL